MYYIRQTTGLIIVGSLGLLSIIICGGALLLFQLSSNINIVSADQLAQPKNIVTIDRTPITVDIASTPDQWTQGLSGRDSLVPNTGLFFIFDKPDYWSIWMKDMNFPIDVLWITSDMKISDIVKNMTPDSYPQTYEPHQPVSYVLELPAGTVDKDHFKVGDTVIQSSQS